MNLHEYQSKGLFRNYAIPVPDGVPLSDVADVENATLSLGGDRWVVKAQAHTGGRGKAGGVVLTDGLEQTRSETRRLLGSVLTTQQTGAEGLPVNEVLIEKPTAIARELYLSVLVDRATRRVVFMASEAGGMNIEEVAAATPEKIITISVNPVVGLHFLSGGVV